MDQDPRSKMETCQIRWHLTARSEHGDHAHFCISYTVGSSDDAMRFDDDGFHSNITCKPDSLESKLVVGVTDVKASPRMGEPTQYVLRCSLVRTDLAWTVERRYSEFLELRKALHAFFLRRGGGACSNCFGCAWFAQSLRNCRFPRRHLLFSRFPDVINQRRIGLHQFARLLVSHTFSAVPKCVVCAKTIFPLVRGFFLRGASLPDSVSLKSLQRSLRPEYFSPIADPSKSKIEFRKARSVWKVLQIEKPVCFKLSELAMHQQSQARRQRKYSKRTTIQSPVRYEDRWRTVLEASDSISVASRVELSP